MKQPPKLLFGKYRYSESDIQNHGGLANLKKAILAARNLDKDELDKLTARLSKSAQQEAMERSAAVDTND